MRFNNYNVMLDLETFSTHPDAAIVSVGAVAFTKTEITGTFHQHVEFATLGDYHVSPSTVGWWLSQSNDAIHNLINAPKVPIKDVLVNFSNWIALEVPPRFDVWACSPSFDCVILRSAYLREGVREPWQYSQERCFRTLRDLAEIRYKPPAVAHDALADAIAQTKHLQSVIAQAEGAAAATASVA